MQTESRSQRIAVTGATGRVGSPLVEILEQRGHEVVQISRSKGVDVVSGEGLEEALAGVETIVDTATGPSPDQEEATAFFTSSARNVHRAGAAAGAKRIVVVSIIGIDKFEGGYNAAKVAQEQTLLEGPLPVRVVRAAQFHEFVDQLAGWTVQDGVAHIPEMRTRPVAARVVAEALADAAEEAEIENGRITEVAGPKEERLAELATALFASRGQSVEIREERESVLVPDADDPDAKAYAAGAALPNPGAKLAGPSFEEWLAADPIGMWAMAVSRAVPNISSDQPAETKEFFADLLGLEVAMDLGWVMTLTSPTNPTAQVTIISNDDPSAPGISVGVDDVDAVHAKAVELGLEIAYPLRDEEWGVRRFMVREPSGTTVNIVAHRSE